MPDTFVAIDFETANADLASICQVGVATFDGGRVLECWGSLVDPQDDFDWVNVDIHGIDENTVQGAPTFDQLYPALKQRLQGNIVVSHTAFDRIALSRALEKYNLATIACQWLDSARVVRRAWRQWSFSGYGLRNVCKELQITFTPHDAVEDARAAGEVLLAAIKSTSFSVDAWLTRVEQPINPDFAKPIALKGNPDGPLFGEELVFTGALTLPRREAAALAAKVGCDVAATVRKTTTVLVVGDQDIQKLAGHEKSIKHRKAEELIMKGHSIRILQESDFLRICDATPHCP
jgi:DNA polymerase III subunit epsilon